MIKVHWSDGTVDCVGKSLKDTPGARNQPDTLPKTEKNLLRVDTREDFPKGIGMEERVKSFIPFKMQTILFMVIARIE